MKKKQQKEAVRKKVKLKIEKLKNVQRICLITTQQKNRS